MMSVGHKSNLSDPENNGSLQLTIFAAAAIENKGSCLPFFAL
jgi:hypothetical protein